MCSGKKSKERKKCKTSVKIDQIYQIVQIDLIDQNVFTKYCQIDQID